MSAAPASAPRWLTWLAHAGALAGLAWALYLLRDAWPVLQVRLPQMHGGLLALGFFAGLAGTYLNFVVFERLFSALWPGRLPRAQLQRIYFLAQLLKHLPGRIWGVLYQSSATREVLRLADWIAANGLSGLLALYFALAASVVVLVWVRSPLTGAVLAVLTLACYFAAWQPPVLRCLLFPARWLPQRLRSRVAVLMQMLAGVPAPAVRAIALYSVAGWLLYLSSWACYGAAYPELGATAAMQLCAYYTVAWLLGYLSMITPSGLGVRELAFVWLARSFPPDVIAVAAVLGRLSLLLNDAILGALFSAVLRRHESIR